jgi:uncharacterized protein
VPTRSRPAHLDPAAPLVLDTRDLARRPGSQRTTLLHAAAPEGLGLDLIRVPAGAPLDLRLRLESVLEGVLVTGRVEVPLAGECGRCLDPMTSALEVGWQELYAYPESEVTEDEASRLDGDYLDLEPVLRDSVVLALPLTPLCRDDCPGLCIECGARKADGDCGHGDAVVDPRWAALAGWDDRAEPGANDEE